MIIKGIYHILGNDEKSKEAIKNAGLEGYIREDKINKFLREHKNLNITKSSAECF